MRKILILDKDGVLVNVKSLGGHQREMNSRLRPLKFDSKTVQPPDVREIESGITAAIALAKKEGYEIALVSNRVLPQQLPRPERMTIAEFNYLHRLLNSVAFSVFRPDDSNSIGLLKNDGVLSSYRRVQHKNKSPMSDIAAFDKSGAGMLQYVLSEFGCNKIMCSDKILYIGDRPEDEEAAIGAGVTFIWSDVFCRDYQRFL